MFVYRWIGLNIRIVATTHFALLMVMYTTPLSNMGLKKKIQRCVQNHVGCEITFSTISLSYLANYLYVNLMLFLEGLEYNGSSMTI